MSVINELIRTEANGTLSFGNYSLAAKSKVEDFEHEGDLYKVREKRNVRLRVCSGNCCKGFCSDRYNSDIQSRRI